MGTVCDTEHYLVIAKVRERLAVGKQAAQRLDRQRFNPSKLNELEVRKKYQVEITNMFAALETLNEDEDVNRIWGNIEFSIQISAKESLCMHEWKQHNSWFDEDCLDSLDQRKRAKIQWVQDPCQRNINTLNRVKREVSRLFRKKRRNF